MQIDESAFERLIAYMHERERVRIAKENGLPFPWTPDVILQSARFTNILRSNDKTTRWLNNHWIIPNHGRDPLAEFMNVAVFRWVGTIGFGERYGWQPVWSRGRFIALVEGMIAKKQAPFTSAYVISNFGIVGSKAIVVAKVMDDVHAVLPELFVKIDKDPRWQVACDFLAEKVNGFGGTGFMAKEVVTDAISTSFFPQRPSDLYSWSPFGPGARRGLNRVYGRPHDTKAKDKEFLEMGRTLYAKLEGWLNLEFMPQPFADFTLHDLQFVMCEFDKYERIRLAQGRSKRGYKP